MTTILTTREKGAKFRERIEKIKPSITSRKSWKNDFLSLYPDFTEPKLSKHIDNVMKEDGVVPVEELLIALEEFAKLNPFALPPSEISQHTDFIRECKTIEEVDIQEARLQRITKGQIPEVLRIVLSNQRTSITPDQQAK